MIFSKKYFFALLVSFTLFANDVLACACGCGIFNVGTSSLIPSGEGGMAFLQYDYINQSTNWNKEKKSAAENNEDKQVKSQVVTAGMQYMFNRKWGAAIRVPYVNRSSKMSMNHDNMEDMDMSGMTHSTNLSRVNSIGDVRINGIYSGFSSDMSTGIIFGLKLPTGQTNAKGFDSRDMQIGTGSTDSILGAYHVGKINSNGKLNWFVQGNWQHAFITHQGYRPGDEFSGATGVSYNLGSAAGIKRIVPILQITGSKKSHDTGWASDPVNSGYSHGYFAPALELTFGNIKTYADIEFPIYQNTNGNQLVADRIYKLILGYNF